MLASSVVSRQGQRFSRGCAALRQDSGSDVTARWSAAHDCAIRGEINASPSASTRTAASVSGRRSRFRTRYQSSRLSGTSHLSWSGIGGGNSALSAWRRRPVMAATAAEPVTASSYADRSVRQRAVAWKTPVLTQRESEPLRRWRMTVLLRLVASGDGHASLGRIAAKAARHSIALRHGLLRHMVGKRIMVTIGYATCHHATAWAHSARIVRSCASQASNAHRGRFARPIRAGAMPAQQLRQDANFRIWHQQMLRRRLRHVLDAALSDARSARSKLRPDQLTPIVGRRCRTGRDLTPKPAESRSRNDVDFMLNRMRIEHSSRRPCIALATAGLMPRTSARHGRVGRMAPHRAAIV